MTKYIKEVWKDIDWYRDLYKISTLWRVKTLERDYNTPNWWIRSIKERILKWISKRNWYPCVDLCLNWNCKKESIHRLVAVHFIDNPENKSQVNHINWIRDDNNINNLEWVTAKENMKHSWEVLQSRRKRIKQYSSEWIYIRTFDSATEASCVSKVSIGNISKCCRGLRNSAGGFKWGFKSFK